MQGQSCLNNNVFYDFRKSSMLYLDKARMAAALSLSRPTAAMVVPRPAVTVTVGIATAPRAIATVAVEGVHR